MAASDTCSVVGCGPAREALEAGKAALVWTSFVADTLTPVRAALTLMQQGRGDFLLESVEGGETRGRYTMLGIDPDLILRVADARAEVNRHWRRDREAFVSAAGPALDTVRSLQAECLIDTPAELPPTLACLVGFFAYETIELIESVAAPAQNTLGLPDMMFVRPSVIVMFDRLKDEAFVVAPIWPSDGPAQDEVARAAEQIEAVSARMRNGALESVASRPQADPRMTAVLRPGHYESMVERAQDYIVAGDVFQVVLAQRFVAPFDLPAIALYRALRRINPSPFLFLLDFPGFGIVGSSPEILVRVRDDTVTIRPIAGTRPRGIDALSDRAAELDLLADPKERAEHLMLLDLGRNDVGRVAQSDSVNVTSSYTVERYSHVMHIVSNVEGKLAEGKDALDALFAGFPAGTVSGAPKVRACEIIAELEPERRGPYAGGVGYFGCDGSIDSCIVLRTAVLKDGQMHVYAGAGIVADSDPTYELRECEAKAGALFAAAAEAVRISREPDFGQ